MGRKELDTTKRLNTAQHTTQVTHWIPSPTCKGRMWLVSLFLPYMWGKWGSKELVPCPGMHSQDMVAGLGHQTEVLGCPPVCLSKIIWQSMESMGSTVMLDGQNLMRVEATCSSFPRYLGVGIGGGGEEGVFPAPLAGTGPFMVHCCPLLALCCIFSGFANFKIESLQSPQELGVGATDYTRVIDLLRSQQRHGEHPASKLSLQAWGPHVPLPRRAAVPQTTPSRSERTHFWSPTVCHSM